MKDKVQYLVLLRLILAFSGTPFDYSQMSPGRTLLKTAVYPYLLLVPLRPRIFCLLYQLRFVPPRIIHIISLFCTALLLVWPIDKYFVFICVLILCLLFYFLFSIFYFLLTIDYMCFTSTLKCWRNFIS